MIDLAFDKDIPDRDNFTTRAPGSPLLPTNITVDGQRNGYITRRVVAALVMVSQTP